MEWVKEKNRLSNHCKISHRVKFQFIKLKKQFTPLWILKSQLTLTGLISLLWKNTFYKI